MYVMCSNPKSRFGARQAIPNNFLDIPDSQRCQTEEHPDVGVGHLGNLPGPTPPVETTRKKRKKSSKASQNLPPNLGLPEHPHSLPPQHQPPSVNIPGDNFMSGLFDEPPVSSAPQQMPPSCYPGQAPRGMCPPFAMGNNYKPGPNGMGMHPSAPPGVGKIYPPNQPMVFNPSNPNAPPIYPCGVCHKEVHDNDEAILCESGCNFWFHRMCTGLTEPAYQMLRHEVYAEWVCDKCLHTKNIPLVKLKP